MPINLKLTNHQVKIYLMALAAAASHSTNAQSEYYTLKRFVEEHPEQQLFILSVKQGGAGKR